MNDLKITRERLEIMTEQFLDLVNYVEARDYTPYELQLRGNIFNSSCTLYGIDVTWYNTVSGEGPEYRLFAECDGRHKTFYPKDTGIRNLFKT